MLWVTGGKTERHLQPQSTAQDLGGNCCRRLPVAFVAVCVRVVCALVGAGGEDVETHPTLGLEWLALSQRKGGKEGRAEAKPSWAQTFLVQG